MKCVNQTSADLPRQLLIRPLRTDDLEFADQVRASCGWNQTLADWRRFIEHEPEGCFCAEWDGVRAGTVTTTRYGKDLAWIGMMLVHPDYRRRGISTGLMNRAIDYLRSQEVSCIKLDATPEGEPVYEKLGFKPEWRLQRWEALLRRQDAEIPVEDPNRDHSKLDVAAFGADRRDWLKKLARDSSFRFSNESGFGMVREGMRANYLGPVVTADFAGGVEICRWLLIQLDGVTFWDIPVPNKAVERLAEGFGFAPTRSLMRMWLGERNVAGDPQLQFGIGEPATG